jgi:hypothetical protein
LTVGILTILTQASFATLLYKGPLEPSMGLGFLMPLTGAVVIGLVLTLTGSFPGTVGRPHELPIVILALLSTRLVGQLPTTHPQADPFATVLVMIAGTTFLFGLLSLLMGMGRAGNLFRFLPYPVLGGFVAGSGMLLAKGGFSVMLSSGGGGFDLPLLLQASSLHLWLPGVTFGLAMFLATRIWRSWLTIPAFLVIGLMVFHGALALSGTELRPGAGGRPPPCPGTGPVPPGTGGRLARSSPHRLGQPGPDDSRHAVGGLHRQPGHPDECQCHRSDDRQGTRLQPRSQGRRPGEPAGRLRGQSGRLPLPERHGPAPSHGGAGPFQLISSLLCLTALVGGQGLVNQIP